MLALDEFTALAVLGASGVDVPLIIVSGESGDEPAVPAIRAGAADFVSLTNGAACVANVLAREDRSPWPT